MKWIEKVMHRWLDWLVPKNERHPVLFFPLIVATVLVVIPLLIIVVVIDHLENRSPE